MITALARSVHITKEHYPALYAAVDAISHDSGSGAGNGYYTIHGYAAYEFAKASEVLATLSPEDVSDFAIGERGDSEAIAARSPELTKVFLILDAFFDRGKVHDATSRAGQWAEQHG